MMVFLVIEMVVVGIRVIGSGNEGLRRGVRFWILGIFQQEKIYEEVIIEHIVFHTNITALFARLSHALMGL